MGLTDICKTNPTLTVSNLGQIVNGLLKLFIDSEREVRKATLNYLEESWIDLEKMDLQPFMPILVMYTCSAMTHIFEDIRTDAVKFMNFWILMAPEIVVSKFWSRITDNYISLVSVDANQSMGTVSMKNHTTTAAIKSASEKSYLHIHKNKLVFFTSLGKFLESGLSEDNQDKFWFLLNYLDSRHSRDTFKRKIEKYNSPDSEDVFVWDAKKNAIMPVHPAVYATAPNLSEGYSLATFSHLDLFESSGPKNNTTHTSGAVDTREFSKQDRLDGVQKLIEAFQPVLVAAWLESAPSVFVTSNLSITPAFDLVHQILKLSVIMWRAAVTSQNVQSAAWLDRYLQGPLKHFLVYFPFGADGLGNRDGKVIDKLMQMNILFCELVSLFLLARTIQGNQEAPEWTAGVVDYLLDLLGYQSQGTTSFKADHLVSLLPALWGFLNCVQDKITLLDAILNFQKSCQSPSAKKIASDFIVHLYTVQKTPHYKGMFRIERHSPLNSVLGERINVIMERNQ